MNKELKKAVNSEDGEIIIKYFKSIIDKELDVNSLKTDGLSDKAIGEEARAVLKSRNFLQKQIKILTEPEEQITPTPMY